MSASGGGDDGPDVSGGDDGGPDVSGGGNGGPDVSGGDDDGPDVSGGDDGGPDVSGEPSVPEESAVVSQQITPAEQWAWQAGAGGLASGVLAMAAGAEFITAAGDGSASHAAAFALMSAAAQAPTDDGAADCHAEVSGVKAESDAGGPLRLIDTERLVSEVDMLTKALEMPFSDLVDDAPSFATADAPSFQHFLLSNEPDDIGGYEGNTAVAEAPEEIYKRVRKRAPKSNLSSKAPKSSAQAAVREQNKDGANNSASEQPMQQIGDGASVPVTGDLSALSSFLAAPSFWPGETHSDDDMDWAAQAAEGDFKASEHPSTMIKPESELEGDINKLSQVLAATEDSAGMALPSATAAGGKLSTAGHQLGSQPVASALATPEMSLRLASSDDYSADAGDISDDDFMSAEMPANIENCLALNTAYQEVVDENLEELEQLLLLNRQQQRQLRGELDQGTSAQDVKGIIGPLKRRNIPFNWVVFVQNYFRDSAGFGPIPNDDTRKKELNNEFEDQRISAGWLQSERETLLKAALADERQKLIQDPRLKIDDLQVKLSKLEKQQQRNAETGQCPDADAASITELMEAMRRAQQQLREAEEAPILEYVSERDPDSFDWTHISLIEFSGQRSPNECRHQWTHFVRPCINHARWDPEEDKAIRVGATEPYYGANRWDNLAVRLGTGRSPFMVFQRWVTALCPRQVTFWTAKETQRLLKVVNATIQQGRLMWPRVATQMPGRTASQCRARYHILSPSRKLGRFTKKEDFQVLAAVEVLGIHNMAEVARCIPGRSAAQVEARYSKCLDNTMVRREWTREEDLKLVTYVQSNGPDWSGAAKFLGRTKANSAVRRRFKRIWCAFQESGKLPDEGELVKNIDTEQHYINIRKEFNAYLESKMKGQGDEARKAAAMTLLDNPGPQSLGKEPLYTPDQHAWNFKITTAKKGRGVAATKKRAAQLVAVLARKMNRPVRGGRPLAAPADDCTVQKDVVRRIAQAWGVEIPSGSRLKQMTDEGVGGEMSDGESAVLALLADDAAAPPAALTAAPMWWRRIPLLPPTYTSVGVFHSLMMWKSQLDKLVTHRGQQHKRRMQKVREFNWFAEHWAERSVTPKQNRGHTTTPWLQPTEMTQEQDKWARVRVVQHEEGRERRELVFTMRAEETKDVAKLAKGLCAQIPGLVQLSISKATAPARGKRAARAPPPDAAAAAWHRLTARFTSLLFIPALMSLQLPWKPDAAESAPAPSMQHIDDMWGHIELVDTGPRTQSMTEPPAPENSRVPNQHIRGKRRPPQPKVRVMGSQSTPPRKRPATATSEKSQPPEKRVKTYTRKRKSIPES